MAAQAAGVEILVRGIVQGVGFRPFIYTLAQRYGLTGWTRNSSRGVEITANGPQTALDAFITAIRNETPPLARIDTFEAQAIPAADFLDFKIVESQPRPDEFIPISPDVSICPDCARELFDPANRRYRYPFINCTNCGPRFSITRDVPYDRPNTTMQDFKLCPACQAEYENPLDRRFHAQPIACPDCGPQLWFEANGKRLADGEAGMQTARTWLQDGKILAVKGLGGFHLVCDAFNVQALTDLRRRKRRSDKAFALMAWDIETIRRYCQVDAEQARLVESRQRPIVLFGRRKDASIPREIAPGQNTIGIMLPYTPMHMLLLEPSPGFPDLLVMTSGNMSEEPIAYEDRDALERLNPLVDGFLLHDRPIHMRVDDSVARIAAGQPYFLRRARGYAPDPLQLGTELLPILGAGAELKNTFCLTRQKYAFISHHIGDLENYNTLQSYEKAVQHFERLFRIRPEVIACDLHPDYLSTRYAQERAERDSLPLIQVQHHHAHMAACIGENGWPADRAAIGLCFDGTGYGTDGVIWGGEILLGNMQGFKRRFHLGYFPLPGGDAAVRKPARTALALLWQLGIPWDPEYPAVKALCEQERTVISTQLQHHLNVPQTSSMGRLFDAVSALIGVRQTVTYEGQAAIELEAISDANEQGSYPFQITADVVDLAPALNALLADWSSGVPMSTIGGRFHNLIVDVCLVTCQMIRRETDVSTVTLSGGVWQNMLLFEKTVSRLEASGFQVLCHRRLPANDGCISLGQVLVADQLVKAGKDKFIALD